MLFIVRNKQGLLHAVQVTPPVLDVAWSVVAFVTYAMAQ